MLSKLNWEMGIFVLNGHVQTKSVTQEENKLWQRCNYHIRPICFWTNAILQHDVKETPVMIKIRQGNITQMWGGWGSGDFQISPLSDRRPEVSNGCPSEIHYINKQNTPQQHRARDLSSSKSQIAFYADISSKPLPMASHSCTGPREIMYKNQQRNVLQEGWESLTQKDKILVEPLRQEV